MAILEGLQDGTIDAVASDHAPHDDYVKKCEFISAANGIIGLQTSLPLALALMAGGKVAPARIVDLLSAAPARILSLKGKGTLAAGADADVTVIDPEAEWEFGPGTCSRSRRTARSSGGSCADARMRPSAGEGSGTRRSREWKRMPERKAVLALADGTVYEGTAFGYEGETFGEVVFNTGMTGYQEVLTDPSYKGQIVTMTYPEIGNTGINPEDVESNRPWVEGFVVKEAWGLPSNWRHVESLDSYLRRYRVCGIAGLDTRALTRRLRDGGSQMAVLSTADPDPGARAEGEGAALHRGARPGAGGHLGPRGPLEHGGMGPGEGIPSRLRVPRPVRPDPADRRDRLRGQAEHPADARDPRVQRDGRAGRRHRGGGPGDVAGRRLPVERAGRPGRGAVRRRGRQEAAREGCRCSGSASGTRSWGWRWAGRPSS